MSSFDEFVLDQLSFSGTVRAKKMFGGTGVYVDEVFCALITGKGLFYLRVDDTNRPDFEAEDMEQFMTMPYFEVPTNVVEDKRELREWVSKARAAAVNAAKAKSAKKKKAASSVKKKAASSRKKS